MKPTAVRVDAILPTFNRAARLSDALLAHARLQVPAHVEYRLIVVDNNCSDDTRLVVDTFSREAPFRCDYVFEPRQGLSHARNTGLAHVTADIIAFIDDDCYPSWDWLRVMTERITADAAPGLLGGSALLFDPADLPVTLVTGKEPTRLTTAALFSSIAGLNFCFRADLLQAVPGFDTCLGAGSATRSGEDIDFFYLTIKAGHPVEYEPRLRVFHHHGRQRADDKQRLMDGYLLGRGAFYAKHLARRDGAIARKAYWEVRSLVGSAVRERDRTCLRYLGLLLKGFLLYASCRLRAALRG